MSDPKINDVPRVDLDIHMDADLRFDVEWWADKDETVPVAIASVLSKAKADSTAEVVLLDIGSYAVVEGNRASVQVPHSVTAALDPLERGVWDCLLISVDGERKKVARGNCRIHRSVSS